MSVNSLPVFARAAVLLCASGAIHAQSIEGRITDASTSEPLARVTVQILESGLSTTSRADGRFELRAAGTGPWTVRAATVGYRPITVNVSAAGPLEIALLPETLRRQESINVSSGPFVETSASAVDLAGSELRNLASVLADDPLRAVQSLPGVTSNDDFRSQFALRGASPHRVGIFIDDVLLHAPFHTIQGDPSSASLTQLQGDLLDSAVLFQGAPPLAFGDRTAGILDLRSREAQPSIAVRGTASMSNVAGTIEGGIGESVNWLVAARKSYLQYIIDATTDDSTIAFAFWDTQGRISWRPARAHQFSLVALDGHSGLDRSKAISRLGLNSILESAYHITVNNLAWRFTPNEKLYFTTRGAWIRERYLNFNRELIPLADGHYGEWVWNTNATYSWNERSPLDAGFSLRRIADRGSSRRLFNPPVPPSVLDRFGGTAVRSGAFAQQSWMWMGLRFRAGARVDHHELNSIRAASPYASVAMPLWSGARLSLEAGQAVQYPEISQMTSQFGRLSLLPERATHVTASLEQTFDERTRLRIEAYNRQDRDLLFRPAFEPRLVNGIVVDSAPLAPWTNSLRGYGRGVQTFLQRRASNGITGWLAYSYGQARVSGGGLSFPSDYDQRHLVQLFASYRIRPTVNVSGKWTYGTGLPLQGFFERRDGALYLSERRNQLRLPNYQRLDLRVNKTIVKKRFQMTIFGEVINVTARDNFRVDDPGSYDRRTGQARVGFDQMFPVLPSAGMVIDFQ